MSVVAPQESPRVLGVCAGIGGLERGAKFALPGARLVGLCERDSYAASVLVARMEDEALDPAPVFAGDLHEFPAADFAGRVDLICGGIPCQPYSVAGKQRRGDDERDLVDVFLAIVGVVGPRYVFVENVAAFAADGLGRLLGGLAALGFDAEWATVRASDVGAPHRRERCFVLGYCDGARADAHAAPSAPRQAARESGSDMAHTAHKRHERARAARGRGAGLEDDGGALANAECKQPERHGGHGGVARASGDAQGASREQRRGGAAGDRGAGVLADGDGDGCAGQRLGGIRQPEGGHHVDGRRAWPLPWPPGPSDRAAWARILADAPDLAPALGDVRRVAHGLPAGLVARADRLRCLGNAVVAEQAAYALRELWRRMTP